jgi:CheY-like chemotaxis protein
MRSAVIADNDPGVRGLLAELARRQGFDVQPAADGEQAKLLLAAGGVDLLVCDLDMPKVTGQQLLGWVAQQPQVPIVVVVSGYVDASIQAGLMAHRGVRTVLRKPFDILAFASLLRGYAAELAAREVASQPGEPGLLAPQTGGATAGA